MRVIETATAASEMDLCQVNWSKIPVDRRQIYFFKYRDTPSSTSRGNGTKVKTCIRHGVFLSVYYYVLS